jgi:dTMP kinase
MRGKLIVLEGLDGSGKATQTEILCKTLANEGRLVRHISFPDYNSRSSELVKLYLEGAIGSLDEVNVFAASSFYSLDRYISYRTIWREDYEENGAVIVADRYTTSNLSHQMSKLPKDQWQSYIEWLNDYEYRLLGLPEPDCVCYLDMDPEASRRLIDARYNGDESKRDLHERDFRYLCRCREAALYAAETLSWKRIVCSDEAHEPIAVEAIAREIRSHLYTVI